MQAPVAGSDFSKHLESPVDRRIRTDLESGVPVVVHVIVALCDNRYQGIIKVPAELGNGQRPEGNLYWGARYGLKTFLRRDSAWTYLGRIDHESPYVLEKVLFRTEVLYHDDEDGEGVEGPLYLVAEAWDGRRMAQALERFFSIAAGRSFDSVSFVEDDKNRPIVAGGHSHVVAFVGHNGIMDAPVERFPAADSAAPDRNAIVLACASAPFFKEHLLDVGAKSLLLTTDLMAPEAYTLEAAVRAWAGGADAKEVRLAAAEAYRKYQKCNANAARRLFVVVEAKD